MSLWVEIKVWQGHALPGGSVPCLVQRLVVVGIPWLWPHLSNLCFHGHIAFSSSLCLSDVYLPFSCIDACMLSHFSRVLLFPTPWTIARQAPQSMGFLRQEYWSGLPCPPPGDLPNPGIKPESLMSPALAGKFLTTSTTWEAPKSP